MGRVSTDMEVKDLHRLAGQGDLIAYFGYGSLVNPKTHRTNVVRHVRARLHGFARKWQARPEDVEFPVALLSSYPTESQDTVDGLLIFDSVESLPSLDEREAEYDRLELSPDRLSMPDSAVLPDCPIYVYTGRAPYTPEKEHFILQSYLDAVLQGYLHLYGEDGARNFVARTAAFDTKLLLDRHEPHYSRSVELSSGEMALIDEMTGFMNRTTAK